MAIVSTVLGAPGDDRWIGQRRDIEDLAIRDPASVYRRVAADELWQEYRRTELALERRGPLVLRARADGLAAATLGRYAEIKRRALL
jgi:hypothetical protein